MTATTTNGKNRLSIPLHGCWCTDDAMMQRLVSLPYSARPRTTGSVQSVCRVHIAASGIRLDERAVAPTQQDDAGIRVATCFLATAGGLDDRIGYGSGYFDDGRRGKNPRRPFPANAG